jgi:hypothetical protein
MALVRGAISRTKIVKELTQCSLSLSWPQFDIFQRHSQEWNYSFPPPVNAKRKSKLLCVMALERWVVSISKYKNNRAAGCGGTKNKRDQMKQENLLTFVATRRTRRNK